MNFRPDATELHEMTEEKLSTACVTAHTPYQQVTKTHKQ